MKRIALSTAAAVALIAPSAIASAQEAPSALASPSATQTVQEVVVTAQKRTERLQDVPQTVNVVQGAQLQQLNLFDFQDIAQLTPGLDLSNPDGRTQAASIRGVRFDSDTGTASTVGIYFNETPIQAADAFQAMYDIGQVETVRGPQGSLRGQPSPSGAVLITTQRPSFTSYGGYIDATEASLATQNFQGAFGGPITDTLAFRVAGLFDRSDDFDSKDIVSKQTDGHISRSGRLTLEWKPTPFADVTLMNQEFDGHRVQLEDVAGSGAFGVITPDKHEAIANGTNAFSDRMSITTLTATVDFLGNRLSYVGGYQASHFNVDRDLDLGNFLPGYQEFQGIDIRRHQVTNELRFERTGQHFWIYRFGVYLEADRTYANLDIDYTGGNGKCGGFLAALGLPCELQNYSTPSRQSGIFTTQTFNITSRDVLDLGMRYSQVYVSKNPDNPLSVSSASHATTGTASFKHNFDRNLMVYVNWGRGFRPGGYDTTDQESNPTSIPTSFYHYKNETSDSYEAGVKASLLGGRIQLDADGFYQRFNNFINRVDNLVCTGNPFSGVGPVAGTVFATNNGLAPSAINPLGCNDALNLTFNGNASSRGAEFDARFRLTHEWTAELTSSWADAHYDNAEIPCNDYLGAGSPNQTGTPAVQAGRYVSMCRSNASLGLPTFYIDGTSEYGFPVGPFEGFVRGLASYRTDAANASTGVKVPDFALFSLFTGLRSPAQHWEFDVFAKNLFDRAAYTYGGPTTSLFTGQSTGYNLVSRAAMGRVVGVTLKYKFGN